MSARSLRRLYECTPLDFKLLIIDCDIPARYRKEIEAEVDGRKNVEFFKADPMLLTNSCKSLVSERSDSELTVMFENDLMVTPGWLESLITAMEECSAEVAVPRLFEGDDAHYHDDSNVGQLVFTDGQDGKELSFQPLAPSEVMDTFTEPEFITITEAHCFVFRTSVLKRIQVFDPALSAREEVDICLALHEAEVPMVLQPKSHVIFMPPPPVHPDERDYYLHKWDNEGVWRTHDYIRAKWHLSKMPTGYVVAETRRLRLSQWQWFKYRATTRWHRAAFKAWKTLRQLAFGRDSRRGILTS